MNLIWLYNDDDDNDDDDHDDDDDGGGDDDDGGGLKKMLSDWPIISDPVVQPVANVSDTSRGRSVLQNFLLTWSEWVCENEWI